MMLADAINLPLVAGLGLVALGPLILLVTVIEALVFRARLKTGFRAVLEPLLFANVVSTLAGHFRCGVRPERRRDYTPALTKSAAPAGRANVAAVASWRRNPR